MRIAVATVAAVKAFEHVRTVRRVVTVLACRDCAVLCRMAKGAVQQCVGKVPLLQVAAGLVMAAGTGAVADAVSIKQDADIVNGVTLHAVATADKGGVGLFVALRTLGTIAVTLLMAVDATHVAVCAGESHLFGRLLVALSAERFENGKIEAGYRGVCIAVAVQAGRHRR